MAAWGTTIGRPISMLNNGQKTSLKASSPQLCRHLGELVRFNSTYMKDSGMLIPFSLVDIFAERPLAGNPLAVVPQAEILDESEMRQIAAEFNQAETTFVVSSRTDDADWRLRSQLPATKSLELTTIHSVHGGGWRNSANCH
ncbi:PhzF family phenazine biosynthesis protein [Acidobacterium sp. S8]|uniref:PhzF family phenazine biosynthesis protein n=1 Tax=Acidobacterium sp. S8 TaxID=1641854 RepID=UPI00352E9726